jgi:flagellar FliL protein
MAKALEAPKSKGSVSFVAMLVATLLCAVGGSLFGLQIPGLSEHGTASGKSEPGAAPGEASKLVLHALAPITTNLASPENVWVRLETAALIKEDLGADSEVVLAKLSEDIVAFMRTVALQQIEGPSGFQHLREDLNDRVRIRSRGKISELLIQALVIE